MTVTPDSKLVKPDVYEAKQIQLTSPLIHVGAEVQRLNPFEYVQTHQRVYLPNQQALARALKERGYLNEYIRRIGNREEIISLLESAFGDRWSTATNDLQEPLFPEHLASQKLTRQKITDLRPMIRTGMGLLYIPGSSIKGAIRTAIAYHMLKHGDCYSVPRTYRVSEIEKRLRESMGNLKQKAKFADDKLFMEQLFADFDLVYQDKPVPVREGPNTDFMRAVHVTDTEPLEKKEVVNKKGQKGALNLAIAAEVMISSRFPDGRAKYRASLYVEMVRLVQTQFTITLDTEMLSWFRHSLGMRIPFQSIDELFKICEEFSQDQWDDEHDYWQEIQDNLSAKEQNLNFSHIRDFYEPEQCPFSLRIGWASGMPGTTVNMLLKDDLRSEIRDVCGLRAPGFEAPKSRRTVINSTGEPRFVLGWSRFKEL